MAPMRCVAPASLAPCTIARTSVKNGYGPAEKDQSNGGNLAGDGKILTLNGVTYTKGLGVHGNSEIVYDLTPSATDFAVVYLGAKRRLTN